MHATDPARSTSNHLLDVQQALIDRAALLISGEIVTHCVRQSLRSCQTPRLLDGATPLKMTTLSNLNNGFGDCRLVSPPSYPSSPRRKEPWKAFITSPSEEGDLGGGIAPTVGSGKERESDLGTLERPGKRGDAEGP